jgi:hypothetical protein
MAKIKIRNSQTGEIREIEDTQLGQFGITPPQAQQPQQQPQDVQSIVDMLVGQAAQGMQSKGMNVPTPQPQPQNPLADMGVIPPTQPTENPQQKYITGYSLQEHMDALNQARAAGDKAAIKTITEDYNREYTYQKDIASVESDRLKEVANKKKTASSLRKEFSKETNSVGFLNAQKSYDTAIKAPKTGAGDLTIIYSYIKSLDPTSVVREGEINLTKAAESVPNNILTAYQRAKEGKVMSDELRGEMIDNLAMMYNERAEKQKELNALYSGLAVDQGVEPNDIIGKVGEIKTLKLKNQNKINKEPESREELLGNMLFGFGKSIAQPFVTTGKNISAAGQLLTGMGVSKVNPELGQKILEKDILGSQETFRKASEDKGGLIKEQAGASLELASPKLLGIAGSKLSPILSKIIPNTKAFKAAVKATPNLKTDKLIKAGEQFVADNPNAIEQWNIMKPTINNTMKTEDLLRKMFDVWSGSFTKGGDIKSTAEGQLFGKLYKTGREIIKKQAPEVSGQIRAYKLKRDLPKLIQKGSWLATKLKFLTTGF